MQSRHSYHGCFFTLQSAAALIVALFSLAGRAQVVAEENASRRQPRLEERRSREHAGLRASGAATDPERANLEFRVGGERAGHERESVRGGEGRFAREGEGHGPIGASEADREPEHRECPREARGADGLRERGQKPYFSSMAL